MALLHDTHSVEEHENNWKKEWKGDIYFNHGSSESCGVAILIPAGLEIEVNEIKTYKEGRILILDMTLESYGSFLDLIYIHFHTCNILISLSDIHLQRCDILVLIFNLQITSFYISVASFNIMMHTSNWLLNVYFMLALC